MSTSAADFLTISKDIKDCGFNEWLFFSIYVVLIFGALLCNTIVLCGAH